MNWISRHRPSPAIVIALIALFVSLSGVSYGVATGFIDSREIKNNQVRSIDIRNNQIRTRDVRNNEVRGIDIRNSTVQSQDIALNAVTGDDINEDTVGKVPGALLADSANTAATATTAGSVDGLKIIDTTVAKGAPEAPLVSNGPLTLLGRCSGGAANTDASLRLDTSEDNTIVADQHGTNPDLDASATPYSIWSVADASPTDRSEDLTTFRATAPSGPMLIGDVSIQADATSITAGACRFQGLVALPV